jgi:uncharacterized protein YbbC (DUF1343 family)
MQIPLSYGIDQLLQDPGSYKEKKLALVTNDAATTATGERTRLALIKNGFRLIRLFSPEHGIAAIANDGTFQPNHTDVLTGLPVTSLYGDKWAPDTNDLEGIDAVIFDIPDVGCRFYTYLWTMTYVMEACAANDKEFLLLDRPNPIGAILENTEGPFLDEKNCSSFIGRWNIPLKHSCTLGELALYFAATRIKDLRINVIKLENYKRSFTAPDEFNFIPTSPAIKKSETAVLYPGLGLLEAVNVNEGRGTEFPFQQFGAPWIHSEDLKHWLDDQALPGLEWKTIAYKAVTGPYANEVCRGLMAIITDLSKLMAVSSGINLLKGLYKLHPKELTERAYRTYANPDGHGHLDKLLGASGAFEKLRSGEEFETKVAREWGRRIQPYLLY